MSGDIFGCHSWGGGVCSLLASSAEARDAAVLQQKGRPPTAENGPALVSGCHSGEGKEWEGRGRPQEGSLTPCAVCVSRSQRRVPSRAVAEVGEEQAPRADTPSALVELVVGVRGCRPLPFSSGRPFTYSPLLRTRLYPHCPPWHRGVKGADPLPQLQPRRPLWVGGVPRRGAWLRRAFTLPLPSAKAPATPWLLQKTHGVRPALGGWELSRMEASRANLGVCFSGWAQEAFPHHPRLHAEGALLWAGTAALSHSSFQFGPILGAPGREDRTAD